MGWLAHGRRLRWPVLAACLVSSLLVVRAGLIDVDEARSLVASPGARTSAQAGEWLHEHYDGGLVLMQRRTNENLLFTSQIPLYQVVYEGDRREWASNLRQPEEQVHWLVMDGGDPTRGAPPDQVWLDLHGRAQGLDGYQRVYQDGPIEVYRR